MTTRESPAPLSPPGRGEGGEGIAASPLTRAAAKLWEPIDIAGLVAFRVFFGLLMSWEGIQAIAHDWIRPRYLEPAFLFKYLGFSWVRPLPGIGMYVVYGAIAVAGLAIALGLAYRAACVLFCACYTYVFLLSPEYYLNHAYLISLVGLVLAFVPAHRALSLDVLLRPKLYSRRVPAWPLWLLIGLLSVVFFFGGLAKLDADWFAGEPLRHWFAGRARTSFLGSWLTQESTVKLVAYTGAIFDLTIPAFLIWRRTRTAAVAACVFFHLANDHLFDIGVFPWFMLAATTLFLDPSWPRFVPLWSEEISGLLDRVGAPAEGAPREPALDVSPGRQRLIMGALACFGALMIFLPLRHHLYPGDVGWNEDGHYFSWRMKIRHKEGSVEYLVRDRATDKQWTVRPMAKLTKRQSAKIVGKPDLILQYAHWLRDGYAKLGMDVEIRCNAFASLNYRPTQRFIDPTVDLTTLRRSIWPYHWVVPFEETSLPGPVILARRGLGKRVDRQPPPLDERASAEEE